MVGIYKITNEINGMSYIGESLDIKRRKSEHFCALKNNKHFNKKLQNAFNKYGEENFTFEIIAECSVEERFELEKYYIKLCNSYRCGYNLTEGGEGMPGQFNPMYGHSGSKSPVYKGDIYQLDLQGNLIDIFGSSCEAAEKLLGFKVARGAANAKGACGHILQCCKGWSKTPSSSERNRFTYQGYQWIREDDYHFLLENGYDFSLKRTKMKNCYPITEIKTKGTLSSNA